jgi:hypothetical protein
MMSTAASSQAGTSVRHTPRVIVGTVLFIAWGIETIMWVGSTIHLASNGEGAAIITAVAALALMCLLAGMEGLEVAVIDRWKVMYADRSTSQLANWLAARQLFVALIVTTATLLANRSEVILPGTGLSFDEGLPVALFDITWTALTVLWFAQIFPKHLAATNPDRYLKHLRGPLFPIVEVVNRSGVPLPGAWVASAVERRLDWPLTEAEEMQEAVLPREESLGRIWRELIPEGPPRGGAQGSPGATESERTPG